MTNKILLALGVLAIIVALGEKIFNQRNNQIKPGFHLAVIIINISYALRAVDNDQFECKNRDKFTSELFLIGENDLFATITTE